VSGACAVAAKQDATRSMPYRGEFISGGYTKGLS